MIANAIVLVYTRPHKTILYHTFKLPIPIVQYSLVLDNNQRFFFIMKVPYSDHTVSDDHYCPEQQKSLYDEMERFEKDKIIKDSFKPAAVEKRSIERHAIINSNYNANEYRKDIIKEAVNKIKADAREDKKLFDICDNLQEFERKVEHRARNERFRLEQLYPIREDKYKYAYFSSSAMHFLMEAVLSGNTTKKAFELLQQNEVITLEMKTIIERYGYDLDVPEYIKKAKRRGSYHIKDVYKELVKLYASQHEGEKYRSKELKQAANETLRVKWQPEEMGALYDNIRLIDVAGMWGIDYKPLYTSSDRGIDGCLAKLARALKLARDSNDLKDSKNKNNCLTVQLETTKAALAALKDTSNEKLPNHTALIKSLCKDKEIKASKMLPILITAGCYSDKDIEDKQTKSKLLANIRQIMSRQNSHPKA